MVNSIAGERARIGLTQQELAEKLDIKDRKTVMRWESDPRAASGDALCKMSELFGCSVDYLLGLTDERIPRSN